MNRWTWAAAGAALLAGALGVAGETWTVRIRKAEVKPEPRAFSHPSAEMELADTVEGVQDGEWVKTDKGGFIHRSAMARKEELLKDPFMSIRISGTFYPEDVQVNDAEARLWVMNPVVRSTGPAPGAWELEEFRKAGGLEEKP